MSEKENKPEIKDEGEKLSLVDVNVALVMAERDELAVKLSEATGIIEDYKKRLANAEALIEEDSKAVLVTYLADRTTMDKALLSAMDYKDLLNMKKVIDIAQIPAFKSGTPISYEKKKNPRAQLDSMFKDSMAKLKGGNK